MRKISDETDDDLARAFAKAPPRYLYRYLPVSDPQRVSWGVELVQTGLLHLSSVLDFNDPFDCLPEIIVPTPAALKIRLRRDRKRVMDRGPKDVGDATLQRLSKEPPAKIRQFAEETFRTKIGRTGVACFSERHDDIGMWSHYANSHRGICVRFDMSRWPIGGAFTMLVPVSYSADRSPFHFPSHPHVKRTAEMFSILTNKAELWSVEREWRLLVGEGAGKKIELPKDLIDGVFFGARVSASLLDSFAPLRRPGLEFQRASIEQSTFSLRFSSFD